MKRHRQHWAVLVLGCIWLFVLHTRFNRAFRSVFRFVSENISDNFRIVYTQTAFFVEKQKALGDFYEVDNFSDNFCVVCTGFYLSFRYDRYAAQYLSGYRVYPSTKYPGLGTSLETTSRPLPKF